MWGSKYDSMEPGLKKKYTCKTQPCSISGEKDSSMIVIKIVSGPSRNTEPGLCRSRRKECVCVAALHNG